MMGRGGSIPEATLQEVRRAATSRVVAELLGAKLNGSGDGFCPIHENDGRPHGSPSFKAHAGDGGWKCFAGCGQGGDGISLWRTASGEEFPEAVRSLAARFGIEIEEGAADASTWTPTTRRADVSKPAALRHDVPATWKPAPPPPSDLRHPKLGEPVSLFALRDVDGRLFGHQVRLWDGEKGERTFRWYRDGRWGLGPLTGRDAPLLGSEDLRTFTPSRPLFLVEGGTAWEALRRVGAQALGTVTGAQSMPGRLALQPLAKWSGPLILWADHDPRHPKTGKHPGLEHMRGLHAALGEIAATELDIRHHLDRTLPEEGTDAREWIEREEADGLTPSEILAKLETMAAKLAPSPTLSGGFGGFGGFELKNQLQDPSFLPFSPLDGGRELPRFPVEVLPRTMGDFVREVARSRFVSPDMPGMLGLGVLGAAGAYLRGRAQLPTHSVGLNLFVVVAAAPGERKSDTLRDMAEPLEERERELVEETAVENARIAEEHRVEAAYLDKRSRKLAELDDQAERRRQVAELAEQRARVEAMVPPARPRLIVGDITPEALAQVLAEQKGVAALVDAEASKLFSIMSGMYSGAPNLDVYLKGHAGDRLRVDRKNGAAVFIDRPVLSIVTTTQPSVLRGLASQEAFEGQGLLARFLYSSPPSLVGERMYDRSRKISPAIRDKYNASILRMLRLPRPAAEAVLALPVDDAAVDVWEEFHNRVERAMRPGGELEGISTWANKIAGTIAGIAGGFTLYEAAEQGRPIAGATIGAAAMARACALGEYLIAHAQAAFETMGADPRATLALRIVRWAREAGPEFSFRDCQQNYKREERADLEAALELLVERGYLARLPTPPPKSGGGRPPGPRYTLSPEAAQNPQNPQNPAGDDLEDL